MSAFRELPPRHPPKEDLDRYRAQRGIAHRRDDRRLRGAIGLVLGAFAGLVPVSLVLLLLALLVPVNSISALGVLLATTTGGMIVGWRVARRPAAEVMLQLVDRWEGEQAEDELDRTHNAIRKGAAALRASGVDERAIWAWSLQKVDVAHNLYLADRALSAAHDEASALPLLPRPSPPPRDAMPISHPPLPELLIAAKRDKKLVPFIGAGLSLGSDVKGGFPRWGEIPRRLLDQCLQHHWHDDDDRTTLRARFLKPDPADPTREVPRSMPLRSMLRELGMVKQKLGHDYGNAISAIFRPLDAEPGSAHRAILALRTQIVLTSNYDQLLEAVEGPLLRPNYTWRRADAALADVKAGRNVLFKVHGSADDWTSIVLTEDEYTAVRQDPGYRKFIDHLLISSSFLFIGYGMSDPQDLDILLAENTAALKGAASVHHALLQRLTSEQDDVERRDRLFRDYRVSVITFDNFTEIAPFLAALARA